MANGLFYFIHIYAVVVAYTGKVAVNCACGVSFCLKKIGIFLDMHSAVLLAFAIEAFTTVLDIFFIIFDVGFSGFVVGIFGEIVSRFIKENSRDTLSVSQIITSFKNRFLGKLTPFDKLSEGSILR